MDEPLLYRLDVTGHLIEGPVTSLGRQSKGDNNHESGFHYLEMVGKRNCNLKARGERRQCSVGAADYPGRPSTRKKHRHGRL